MTVPPANLLQTRDLIAALPVACYTLDESGRITFFNAAAEKLWGRIPTVGEDYWCGSHAMATIDGTPLPLDQCPAAVAFREKRAVRDVEAFVIRPDGTRRWVIPHPQPIYDAAGNCSGLINVLVDVTEQREADEALRISEGRLSLAIRASKVGVWDWDIPVNHVTWSEAVYELHGATPDTFKGTVESFASFIHPEDRAGVVESIQRALASGSRYEVEFRVPRPDGSVVWLFTSAIVIREDGRPVRMLGATHEITPHKAEENRLRLRTVRMQLLSETLGQLLDAEDLDNVVRDLFPKVAAHLGADTYFNFMLNRAGDALELRSCAGVSEEQKRAVRHLQFGQAICGNVALTRQAIHARDIQRSSDPAAALVRGFGIQTYACHPLIAGKSLLGTLSFASHTRTAFDPEEIEFMAIIAQYTGVALDRLRTASERQQLAAIVESSDDAIISKSLDGIVTSWNRGAERVFGYAPHEMLGKSITLLVPSDRQGEESSIMQRIRRGERVDHLETVRRRKDGSLFDVLLIVSPVKDSAGVVVGASKIAHDITARKHISAAIAAQKQALERVVRGAPLREVLELIAHSIESLMPCVMVSVMLLDAEGKRLRQGAAPSLPADFNTLADGLVIGPAVGACGAAAYKGETVVVADIATDPRWSRHRDATLGFGLRACWSTPIRASEGKILGTVAVYHRTVHEPSAHEQEVVDLLAHTAALVIDRDREAALRRTVETHLRESRNRLQMAMDAAQIYSWEFDLDRREVEWSANAERVLGFVPPRDAAAIRALLHPDDAEKTQEAMRDAIQGGTTYHTEVRMINPRTKAVVWLQNQATLTTDSAGRLNRMLGISQNITARKVAESHAGFLDRLTQKIAALNDSAAIIRAVSEALGQHLGVDRCYIPQWTPDGRWLLIAGDYHVPEIFSLAGRHQLPGAGPGPRPAHPLGQVAIALEDVEQQPYARDFVASGGAADIRACAFSQAVRSEKSTLALAVTSMEPRAWSSDVLELLDDVINRVGPLVDRARAERQLATELDSMSRLQELNSRLLRLTDLDAILYEILDAAIAVMGSDMGNIQLRGSDTSVMEIAAQRGFAPEFFAHFGRVNATAASATARVLQQGVRVVIEDVNRDPAYGPLREVAAAAGFRAVQSTPLFGREGEVIGVLTTHFRNPHTPSLRDLQQLDLFVGQVSGLLERVRIQKTLQESEDRLRHALGAANMGAWRVDLMAGTRTRDASLNRILGLPPVETVTRLDEAAPFIHAADRASVAAAWQQTLDGAEMYATEFRAVHPDGSIHWVREQGRSIHGVDDKLSVVTGVAIDITAQKFAAEALLARDQQLRLVADSAPVLLAQIDAGHRYRFVNRPYAARYKLEPHDFTGRLIADVIGEKPYAAARQEIEKALTGVPVEFEMEIDYERHLGRRWVHVTYTPECAPDGSVAGLVAVLSDMTMRKQSELDLEQARDAALAASNAKDEFLAALSHELRTPLNPVLILASDAASNPKLPPEVRADFELIRKNVDLEARLIDDLLDLTRITRGKLPLEMRALNIHDILRDALATVHAELAAKHLELHVEFFAAESMVWGDSVRLQQVLWNVLKNAVKFTPNGGRVHVQTLLDPAGTITIRITDSGIGMTPEERARAFESFTQGEHATKSGSHRFGGLGLGLAISRMLVELHSGRIHAMSAGRNQGSEFTVELPLRHAAMMREGLGSSPSGSATSQHPAFSESCNLSILLVDDHAPTRNTLMQVLRRRKYQVRSAASVVEAKAEAASHPFHLVISDIGLPDGDGYELMSTLLAMQPGLRGIALSGYGMEDDIARSRHAGFGDHLTKPVNITALEEAIARNRPIGPLPSGVPASTTSNPPSPSPT